MRFLQEKTLLKYIQVFKTSWENSFVYRLNFLMWRLRSVLNLLMLYFLWLAVFSHSDSVFGYQRNVMLTYILGTSLLQVLVLGSRSLDISGEISNGNLSNSLLKPLSYLRYWLARDVADKLLNILFVIVELSLIIFLLKPPLVLPGSPGLVLVSLFAASLAMLTFFYLSLFISMIAFWYPEHGGWPARFLFQVIIMFFAGGLFPLDILPKNIYALVQYLPTSYLLFFPLQIWLNRIEAGEILFGLMLMVIWIILLRKTARLIWQKGLKAYEAYGR